MKTEIQGWFDFEDVYRAAVADAPDGATLVEVGCWRGKSLSFLLAEAAASGKRLDVVGVDHFRGGEEEWMREEARRCPIEEECRRNCGAAGYPFRLLVEPSVEAARRFADGSVWFVFVDASHDPASVRADLRAWLPKVARGGRLAGHDWDYVSDSVRAVLGDRAEPRPPSSWEARL